MNRWLIVLFVLCPSAVWADALAQLLPAEQKYHTQIFDYVMDYTKPGEPYPWQSYGGKGSIVADAVFISKSKASCRNFSESFTIGSEEGSYSGIACKRAGGDGWCILRPDQALTCAMETRPLLPGLETPQSPQLSMPNVGGIGSVGSPTAHMNNPVGTPSGVEVPSRSDKPGQPVADTVTGAAGRAAGPATGGMIQWFSDTFR